MKTFRRFAVLLAILASSLGLASATAIPAQASLTGQMCTTFGTFKCIGAPGSPFTGQQVVTVNEPGRTIVWSGGGVNTTGRLCLKIDVNNLCLAQTSASNENVILKTANSSGVDWKRLQGPSTFRWQNVRNGTYLAASSDAGDVIVSSPLGSPPGWNQQWNGPA